MVTVKTNPEVVSDEAEAPKAASGYILTRRLLVGGEVFEAGSPVPEGVAVPKSARKAD